MKKIGIKSHTLTIESDMVTEMTLKKPYAAKDTALGKI